MSSLPLRIYAAETQVPPLQSLLEVLLKEGYPAGIGVAIAGDATPEELAADNWEAAFLRWNEPELHDVALLERLIPSEDEEADETLAEAVKQAEEMPLSGGRFLILDHLRHTQMIYALEPQPALLDEDNHPAWAAFDLLLRTLAEKTEGLIYAEAEGFYDSDGEPMVSENGTEESFGPEDAQFRGEKRK